MTDKSENAENMVTRLAGQARDGVEAEIADLRAKVEHLMSERVEPAMAQITGRATELGEAAVAGARHQARRISGTVQEQPIAALAMAAVAGGLLAYLIRR